VETTTEILVGVALLTGLACLLTLTILLVRGRLLPSGEVRLRINDSREISVLPGGKLHEALATQGILLPTACGGKGSCGQCRVQVVDGGGALVPVESALLSRAEASEGYRLACQLSVLEDMQLKLPESLLDSKKWVCTVRSNRNVATFIKELVLELPKGETLNFQAGGYVQIECPPHQLRYSDFDIDLAYRADWERLGLFELESGTRQPATRAYSMANCPTENDLVVLNVRIATPPPNVPGRVPPGVVSSWIFNLKPGDRAEVAGPFGEFFYRDSAAEMIYIGGGAGMAPLRSHILDLLGRLGSQRSISYWYGARSLREAFYVEEFRRLEQEHPNFSFKLALSAPLPEDQWTGLTGLIHDVIFEHYLGTHPAPEDCEYYLCGPPMMIAAVNSMLQELGVDEESILYDDFGA
jgi:Na+-transporting NADH:ubiquinone oxidoreductase subunit F